MDSFELSEKSDVLISSAMCGIMELCRTFRAHYYQGDAAMFIGIVGKQGDFSIQERGFNLILFSITIAGLFNFCVKEIQGTSVAPEVLVIIVLLVFTLYLLARFGRYFEVTWRIFAALSYVFLGLIFMIRGELDGPVILLFFLVLAALMGVTPKRMQVVWLVAHTLVFVSMVALAYSFELPRESSLDLPGAYAIDLITTFFLMVVIAYVVAVRIRQWNIERVSSAVAKHVEDKAGLIEENKHLNRLFSVVSHDVRSPLNSISGYLELLKHATLEPQAELKLRNDLLLLTRSTSLMLDQMLIWSRTQVDGYRPQIEELYSQDVLKEPLSILRPIGEFKAIQIDVECTLDTPISTDPMLFSSIVRNLLHNAIKFSPKNSQISLRLYEDKTSVILEVVDQGVGLSAFEMERILSYNGPSSKGTLGETGMGVGMRICYEFSLLLNGRIELVPTKLGTTIRVVFEKKRVAA